MTAQDGRRNRRVDSPAFVESVSVRALFGALHQHSAGSPCSALCTPSCVEKAAPPQLQDFRDDGQNNVRRKNASATVPSLSLFFRPNCQRSPVVESNLVVGCRFPLLSFLEQQSSITLMQLLQDQRILPASKYSAPNEPLSARALQFLIFIVVNGTSRNVTIFRMPSTITALRGPVVNEGWIWLPS
eukprot:1023210-Rhodomonas_salina.1